MCSNEKTRRSVVARLTFGYALICILFCAAVFMLVSVRVKANTVKRIDQMLADEVREFSGIYQKEGLAGLQAEFEREANASGSSSLFCRFLSPQNDVLLSSDISAWENIHDELLRVPPPDGRAMAFATLYPESHPLNARVAAIKTSDGHTLQFGVSLRSENRSCKKTRRILGAALLLMIALSTLSGWLIARRAMSGVQRVTRAVADIRKDNLHRQVPAGREGREINELAGAFNQMLRRIERLVRELKEISDNIAHDLRSPITRMRGAAETTLTGPQDAEAYREMGITIIEECDRLTGMINTMLEIAQSESGVLDISRAPVDLTELLKNAADLFLPSAEEKQIELTAELPGDPLIFSGDKTRLQRAAANLIDNAIKYTPAGGNVRLVCRAEPGGIRIEVRDSGIGMAPDELPRIFDRFYRGEKSRSSPGSGLGLSLVRSIIHAHGGHVSVQSTPGQGSVFSLFLPRGDHPDARQAVQSKR